jgi:hypothetical protein
MDYEISLTVEKDIEVKGKRVGEYFVDGNTIYYSIPYPFPCKFKIINLEHIVVTPMMLKLPTFLKWHNIDWLRQQLMQVKCVRQGAVLLHGAAWKKYGVGYLAVGFANSGKTTMILRECSVGALYCSDENVIVNSDGLLLPVERPSFVNRWHTRQFDLTLTLRQKIALIMAEIKALCPLFEPNIWVELPWERRKFKLDKIIWLTPGKGTSLLTLTNNEFPFYSNPVLQTYAYATGWNLDELYKKYRDMVLCIQGNYTNGKSGTNG